MRLANRNLLRSIKVTRAYTTEANKATSAVAEPAKAPVAESNEPNQIPQASWILF